MRVNAISSKEADDQAANASFDPWPPGEYDFVVHEASEETSSTGNDMIKLTLHVFNREGRKRTVFDYLVNADNAQWKIRHFCESVGLLRQYETGDLDVRDIVTRPGRCKLRIKPATGQYAASNAVNDYISQQGAMPRAAQAPTPSRAPARSMAKAPAGDIDDEIPF